MKRLYTSLAVSAAALVGLFLAGGVLLVGLAALPLLRFASSLRSPFAWSTRAVPTGPVVLEQVQRLQRLETCRYNGHVVVRGDTGNLLPTWLAGDRMLFVGHGEVVAGIDLARLRPEDVRVSGAAVELRLPPAQILHTALDTRDSAVYDRQSGILTGPDRDLERRVRLEAEERIRQAALDRGVLDTARGNARETMRRQLSLLGFQEVRIL